MASRTERGPTTGQEAPQRLLTAQCSPQKDSEPQRGQSLAASSHLRGERSRGQSTGQNQRYLPFSRVPGFRNVRVARTRSAWGTGQPLTFLSPAGVQARLQSGVGQPYSSGLLGTMLCQSCLRQRFLNHSLFLAEMGLLEAPLTRPRTKATFLAPMQLLRVTETNRLKVVSRGAVAGQASPQSDLGLSPLANPKGKQTNPCRRSTALSTGGTQRSLYWGGARTKDKEKARLLSLSHEQSGP